jgi:hypothetical protein
MTHFSENPGMVRVDYFKPSGKWYMTEAIDMSEFWDHGIIPNEAVKKALDASRPKREPGWWRQFTVVVTEPYHKSAYPVMIVSRDR